MAIPGQLVNALRRRCLGGLAVLTGASLSRRSRARSLAQGTEQGMEKSTQKGTQKGPGEDAGEGGAIVPAQSISLDDKLQFPRDFGAHPGLRTEWWYLTGVLRSAGGLEMGCQVTFFRSRGRYDSDNPSRFTPHQFLIGHVALACAAQGRLIHEQAIWRGGFDKLAWASPRDCDLRLPGWSMRREAAMQEAKKNVATPERYLIDIRTEHLQIQLQALPAGPPLLQGQAGYSRKGPSVQEASHYYSRPQLRLDGQVAYQGHKDARKSGETGEAGAPASSGRRSDEASGKLLAVQGSGWMDHEWSNEVLDTAAAGWDWMGLNLDDGSSLMAFRIRAKNGGKDNGKDEGKASSAHAPASPDDFPLWTELRWFDRSGRVLLGTAIDANAATRAQALHLTVLETWQSLRSGGRYPVKLRLDIAASGALPARRLELQPLMVDQEIDARKSTGGFYWEGLVFVHENGKRIGQGYLELTGYAAPLRL